MNTKELFESIINEAKDGRVDCYFVFNVLFETMIEKKKVTENTVKYDNCVVPILEISNSDEFYKLLDEYLNLALDFYKEDKYLNDLSNEIDRKKTILTVLWSNATYEDFAHPNNYLRQRIAFLKNKPLENTISTYSEILECMIEATSEKESVLNETPYNMSFRLYNDNNEEFFLPTIRVGIASDKAYVYSIQNRRKNEKNKFTSKIKRKLYLINDGFQECEELYAGIGELKDTTMSFILSTNMALSILKNSGIDIVDFVSLLITRWNAKEIATDYRAMAIKMEDEFKELIEDFKKSEHEKNVMIQNNITNKFLRTILRVEHAHSGITISKMPLDGDFNLGILISDEDVCNNELLKETYNAFNTVNKSR